MSTTRRSIKTILEAHLQREPHHLSPKSAANRGFLADPDIDGAHAPPVSPAIPSLLRTDQLFASQSRLSPTSAMTSSA